MIVVPLNSTAIFILLPTFGRKITDLSNLWPIGLDPLSIGLAITSLTVTIVIAVGVTQFPHFHAVRDGKESVDAYVRAMHLVQTARLVATVSGVFLLGLVPLMALGDAYRVICAVVFAFLGLLCFRLSCAVPLPIAEVERHLFEEESIFREVAAETDKLQSALDARGGVVAHPWPRLVRLLVVRSLVFSGVLIVGLAGNLRAAGAPWPTAIDLPIALLFVLVWVLVGIYVQGVVMWGFFGCPAPQYGDRDMAWLRVVVTVISLLSIMLPTGLAASNGGLTGIWPRYLLAAMILWIIVSLLAFHRSRTLLTLRQTTLEKRSSASGTRLEVYKQLREARRRLSAPDSSAAPSRKKVHPLICLGPLRRAVRRVRS